MARDMTEDGKTIRTRPNTIIIDDRERVNITGVQDVDSFNEEEVVLVTDIGFLNLTGQDLHITKLNLDDGELIVEGYIYGLQYSDHDAGKNKASGIFSRIFR